MIRVTSNRQSERRKRTHTVNEIKLCYGEIEIDR